MMSDQNRLATLQDKIWQGSISLRIKLSPSECRTYEDSQVYMIQWPRLSYLPFLLTRLHAFFQPSLIDPDTAPHSGWFSFEGVTLKWQHPLGLLYDLFSGATPTQTGGEAGLSSHASSSEALPWQLVVQFRATSWPSSLIPLSNDGKVLHDVFINSVKEADHLRNGTARAIMSLGVDDGDRLWRGVQTHDLRLFSSINDKLLNAGAERGEHLRHIPIKVYLPSTSPGITEPAAIVEEEDAAGTDEASYTRGTLKVVQMPVAPAVSAKEPQTLGTALHGMLPSIFPSRRNYIHAHAVMHGVVMPLAAPLKDLMHCAAYCDGFLHVGVVMIGG